MILVTPSGGTPPYIYSFDGAPWIHSDFYITNGPSSHTVAVKDATGAIVTTTVLLTNNGDQPDLQYTNLALPSGCGKSDGSISVRASGGTPPYTYSMDNISWQSSGIFTNMSAGSYILYVKDANGCIHSILDLLGGCLTMHVFDAYAPCGLPTGIIGLSASGDAPYGPPYQYSLDGITWQSTGEFRNKPAGLYTVQIRDGSGNLHLYTTLIVNNCDLQVSATTSNNTCGQSTASITVTVNLGHPPYQYSLDGVTFQASNIFTGLSSGVYSVLVKDVTGQLQFTNVQLYDNCPTVTAVATDANCGSNDAVITATGSGGTPPYQYALDIGLFQTSNIFTNNGPGDHTVTIKDHNNFTTSTPVTVRSTCLQLTATATGANCGHMDGRITAIAINGTEPYQYSLDGINFQPSPIFTSLPPGPYGVWVTDAGGQSTRTTVTVSSVCLTFGLRPAAATCGKNNGTITVISASGGTEPYQYSLDGTNFQYDLVFAGVAPGPYTVTMRDALGNSTTMELSMVNVQPPPSLLATPMAATCVNNDGSLLVSGNGGTPPYQYSLDGGGYAGSGSFDHLASGDHLAAVKDAIGCEVAQTVAIVLNNNLTADGGADVPVCEGRSGVIRAVSNGTNFSWQPAAGLDNTAILQPTASPETSTTYYLTASSGPCQLTVPVNVVVSPAPVADAGKGGTICHGQSIQLEGSGGKDYSWDPALYLSDPTLPNPVVSKPAQSITYRLTVTAENGCRSLQPGTVTVNVTLPPKLFAGNDTSILAGQPLPLHAVDLDNSGLNHWRWSPAAGLDNDRVQDPVARPGESVVYTVVAATDAGCEATAQIAVKVFSVTDIFVPNAFTPNGDGHNDILKAIPVGIKEFRYFAVLNRWGQRIFYTTDAARGWDGVLNGRVEGAGTFVWMAGGIDYKGDWVQRQGTVLLIR